MALTPEEQAILEQKRQAALQRREKRQRELAQQLPSNNNQLPSSSSYTSIRPPQTSLPARAPVNLIPRPSVPNHSTVSIPSATTNHVITTNSLANNRNTNQNFNYNRTKQNFNYNRTNPNSNFNRNGSQGSGPMSQIRYHDKYSKSYFITPNKRPLNQGDNEPVEKRQNTQAKSPYEQVMDRSIPYVEINFKLLNNREFYLDFKYNSKLIEEIKKFPGSPRYNPKIGCWVLKLEFYKEIVEKLKALRFDRLNLKINPGIPENVITLLKDTLKYDEMKVDLEEKIPLSVIRQLFPYQREGIKFGIKREGRCLLADDCGLGKTMQAIGIALYYMQEWPLLIVCPASVKFQWRDALLKWVPSLQSDDIKEIDSKKDSTVSSNPILVVITSYDSVHKVEQYLTKSVNCAILDECHMVKASKTKRFTLISKLVNKSKRLILISGTPAMSRPSELYTQLKLLMPKVFSNKERYENRYCDPKITQWGRQSGGCTNPEELKVILLSTVMVRRMKDDVLNELPPKRRIKINLDCHLTGKDKSEIEKFVARFKGPQQMNEENESFTTAYMRTAEIKLTPIKNYLELVIEKETKFLFFAHHKTMIESICEYLNSKKIQFIKIDGSTSSNERSRCCEHFQANNSCKAAVLSITAAGVGLNLTAAQLVIFGELYYNPGALIQAEDRVHRIGQKDSVYIEYLIAPGTVDDHIWNMVHRKVETLDSLGIKNDGFEFDKDAKS